MSTQLTSLWPIPVQLLARVATELKSHNVTIQELLYDSDVTEKMLFESETMLSYRETVKIIQRALKLSPIAHIGLALGATQSPSAMGVLGYTCNCCATVKDAMNMAVKYQRVSSTLSQAEWHEENGHIYWKSKTPIDLGKILPCAIEEEFLTLYKSFEMLTGKSIQFLEMHFQYPEPEYVSLYQEMFNCPLYFSADENIVVMSNDILNVPILQANSLSIAAAERMCINFMQSNPIIEDMEMYVRQLMVEQEDVFPDEELIADKLNITSRTLRNKLALLGTSFRKIADSIRKKHATKYLQQKSFTMNEIAEKTGYSDARSFRRAFKKWTGTTPDKYRKSYLSESSTTENLLKS